MKKKLLIITRYFYPAYRAGGPAKSVTNMTYLLKKSYNISIICSSKDLGSKTDMDIGKNEWINNDNFSIFYGTDNLSILNEIRKSIKLLNPDLIYIPSFFDKIFSFPTMIYSIFSRSRLIISPKGELFEGALRKKKIIKLLYIFFFKYFLSKNISWHATNLFEKESIVKFFCNTHPIKVIDNVVISENKKIKNNKKKINSLKIVILGRISPVKNTYASLQFISTLKGSVQVDLWGEKEISYWNKCLGFIKKLPKNVIVNYMGVFEPNDLDCILSRYDILLLPSLSENFGYAIFECLSRGLPVVISNKTPWRNLEKKKIGYDIDIENSLEFEDVLKHYLKLNNSEFLKIRNNCYSFALDYTLKNSNKVLRSRFIKLFEC